MKANVATLIILAMLLSFCNSDGKKSSTSTPEQKTETKVVSTPDSKLGIGPIKHVSLGNIDQTMVAKGKEVFIAKCSACHKISKRVVGPALAGVTERRSPEWIMNMIMNPEEMVAKDPVAKQLLAEYLAPMANQNVTEEEARLLLEYFRTKTASSAE
jgi:cytochrome c